MIFTGESVATRILEPNLQPGEVASPVNSFLAGSAGGLLQCVILVPSEVIKCTMQAGSIPSIANSSGAFAPTIETIRYIQRTEGIRGLYKGLGVTCLREIPAIGIYFFSYKNIRSKLHSWQGGTAATEVSTPATMVAGAVAGALSWLLLYPIDVIKTNMQSSVAVDPVNNTNSLGNSSSSSGVVVSSCTTSGSTGVRCAATATGSSMGGVAVSAAVPTSAGVQSIINTAKSTTAVGATVSVAKVEVASAAAVASVAYQDMMFWEVGRSLYRRYGMVVFYRGVGTAVVRALPVNAAIFYIYEKLKVLI